MLYLFTMRISLSMAFRLMALSCLVALAPGLSADDATPDSVSGCFACHGDNGVSVNPLVPTLAGQPFTLIEDNLLAFRSGKRVCTPESNGNSPSALLASTMCESVKNLSNADIAAIAGHFEEQTFRPAAQAYDDRLTARGMAVHHDNGCEQCHSGGGTITNSMAPILAGQWSPYLRRALAAIREGTRKGPVAMNGAVSGLGEEDVEALVHFYASRQGTGLD